MKLKTLASSIVLACAAGGALADDQSVAFSGLAASFDSVGTVLAGGDDVISFTGLAAGFYDFTLTMSAQYLTLDPAMTTLNGITGTVLQLGNLSFVGIENTTTTPLVLTLAGSAPDARAIYSGELTVTAVPEPQTYAMMLAGLGALGFIARRRRPQA